MAITSPTTPPADGAALPTPPSSSSPSNFDTLADAFLSAFPAFQTSMNATKANAYTNATAAYNNALQSQSDATIAQAAATTAQTYAGATAWVSGTTYVIGDVRWSPGNGRVYRRITNGGGTTDPYNDPTNWSLVPTSVPITRLTSALVTQASSGMFYEFANSTTQGAATNLLLYSLQQDNAAWTKTSATVSADFTMSPSGDVNADKLIEVAATAAHYSSQPVTIAANQAFTLSIYAKAAGRSAVSLRIDKDSAGTDYINAKFDLTTGATSSVTNNGTASGASATSTYVGNGWWLCALSGTPASAAGTVVRCYIGIIDFSGSNVGDGTSGIYVSHAQLETGATASSRINTSGTSATRASGVVYPQRLVLPSSPVNDMIVQVMVANGIDTNIVDPNGATIMGTNGPIQLDNPYASVTFQYSSSTWRMINA